jgi:hypothetical protein
MAGTRAKALQRCKQPWVLEATAVMQQSADKGQTAHGSDLHLPAVMYGAEVWDTTKAVKDKMSVSPAPASRSSDVLYDTGLLPPGVSLMLPNCVGSTDARTWRLADGPRRRCDSHSRVAVVSA